MSSDSQNWADRIAGQYHRQQADNISGARLGACTPQPTPRLMGARANIVQQCAVASEVLKRVTLAADGICGEAPPLNQIDEQPDRPGVLGGVETEVERLAYLLDAIDREVRRISEIV